LKEFLFSIHTYYAFLMKLIAMEVLALQSRASAEWSSADLAAFDDQRLFERLEEMESGAGFVERGITNFLEADFFGWYLDAWEEGEGLVRSLREVIRALSQFEAATPVLAPSWTRDLLQKLYELMVPGDLRHDLGEFYTPDWLAEYVVGRTGYDGESGKRFLDPACGSGTFLVQAIHRKLRRVRKGNSEELKQVGRDILENVIGFDINPMAVLAARTNYLLSISRLIPYVRPISLPVYLCDSVVPPARPHGSGALPFDDTIHFATSKKTFRFPTGLVDKQSIDWFTSRVEQAIRIPETAEAFKSRIESERRVSTEQLPLLVEIYAQIKALHDVHEDGIWARYIKNSFAPAYVGTFDYVVGNPPWIRWG
jgi:hypothetical protein